MVKELPQIEDSAITHYIEPKGQYTTFNTVEDFLLFTRKWGLNTGTSEKETFWYKESYYKRAITLVGYESYSQDYQTAVIQFLDGNLCCINPSYLKDMQKGDFGEEHDAISLNEQIRKAKMPRTKHDVTAHAESIVLPVGKTTFRGTLDRFDELYNNYTEKVDAVIIWRNVTLADGAVKLDFAWCGYSKTLEKLELSEGVEITCLVEAVEKRFDDAVIIKVNRPSKIEVIV